jgi:adenine-specific DNA-methyltransferase
MLMDEVFDESNSLAIISWQKVFAPKPAAKKFSTSCEYLVAYARKADKWDRLLLPRTEEQDQRYTNPDNDPRGPWASDNLLRNEHRDNSVYTIVAPSGKEWTPEPGTSWRHPESEMLDLIENNEIWFGEDGNNMPRRKKFLADVQKGRVPETLWPYDEVGHTQDAKRELTRILGASKKFFPYPKPVDLIARVIQITTRPGEIVLDSCAGSGTTGQAVMAVNQEDNGDRQFVLVQLPHDTLEDKDAEFNICREATRARVERVIDGYSYTNQRGRTVAVAGLGGSFTYVSLGDPLFGEYKDFGDTLPAYEDIAKYVFYTETSREFPGDNKKQNPAWDKKIGRIGEHAGRSYYLLYDPNERLDRGLDRAFLNDVASKDPNRELVVYCERIAVHQDELRKFHREHGKKIRPMLVPFNLK